MREGVTVIRPNAIKCEAVVYPIPKSRTNHPCEGVANWRIDTDNDTRYCCDDHITAFLSVDGSISEVTFFDNTPATGEEGA